MEEGEKIHFYWIELKKKINSEIELIDDLEIDGDFIESQAFAYLAIRSYLGYPISFPDTTGATKASTGGILIKVK